jgi:lysozyme
MKLSSKGLDFIAEMEGFSSKPYQDQGGVWTIGYGSTYNLDGTKVHAGTPPITIDVAKALLMTTMTVYEQAVNRLSCNQNQFDAMVSLCYNIGPGNFLSSSVFRNMKQGKTKEAADAFLLWNKTRINGVLTDTPGLTNRRKKEGQIFLS